MVAIEALLSSMAVDSDSQDGYLLDNSGCYFINPFIMTIIIFFILLYWHIL